MRSSHSLPQSISPYRAPDGKIRNFVWDSDGFRTIDFADTIFTRATAINPQGDIVGFYRDLAGRDHRFLLQH